MYPVRLPGCLLVALFHMLLYRHSRETNENTFFPRAYLFLLFRLVYFRHFEDILVWLAFAWGAGYCIAGSLLLLLGWNGWSVLMIFLRVCGRQDVNTHSTSMCSVFLSQDVAETHGAAKRGIASGTNMILMMPQKWGKGWAHYFLLLVHPSCPSERSTEPFTLIQRKSLHIS